jgi:hypothetical protein
MVDRMKAPLPKERSLNPALLLLWLGLAVWSVLSMMSYSNQPGPAEAAPAKWPSESKLPCPTKTPSIIMFVHPHCTWSKASLDELASLMKACQGRVNAYVLFLKPTGQASNWVQTDLWRQAAAIPGVNVMADDNGFQARLFGAETSGEVLLYGAQGRLRFQGGLTISRGRVGENPGRKALQALIFHQQSQVTQTPVFGCPLSRGNLTSRK